MAIVAANTAIGIIQEIRAKRSIDSLSFLTAAKAKVLRDGESSEIPIDEIVLDDIIILSAGDQVPTDCIVASGFCEADESFLTGESDAISKTAMICCWPAVLSSAAAYTPGQNGSAPTIIFPKFPPQPKP